MDSSNVWNCEVNALFADNPVDVYSKERAALSCPISLESETYVLGFTPAQKYMSD